MSEQYPYRNPEDDFPSSHQNMYTDSYQRHSDTYRPDVRSLSQEQKCSTTSSNRTVDPSVHLPGMALSFLHSCGLDSSDLAHLAELPEHLITVETLPQLLLQVKEHKLSSASSSRPLTGQPLDEISSDAWEDSSHTRPIEYPIDRPPHPVYPLPPEQVQTWQDRWGNRRQRSSSTTDIGGSTSQSISVPDYSIYMDTDPYYDSRALSPEASSHPLVDCDLRPLLSLKLDPPVIAPTRMEALDFNCKGPPVFPHVCSLCDISVRSKKDWTSHVRGSDHSKSQLKLVKKYPKWDQTIESARRNERSNAHMVPTRRQASDFNGIVPPVYPYLCVLCNIAVFSETDWSVHVTGGQHAKGQLDLMQKYTKWDGTVQSSKRTSPDGRDDTSKESTSDLKMSQAKDKSSRVVSFTQLPAEKGISSELTAIVKRFGSIKRSLFLTNRGYVEMTCLAEAKNLVEHYTGNQLKLKGKLIKVTHSCKYNSLREVECKDQTESETSRTQRRSSQGRHSIQRDSASPKRGGSSEKTHSSPKRRRSSERTHSSPKKGHSSEKSHSSPKRGHSSEKTHSSPKRRPSSKKTHSSPRREHSSEGSPKRGRSSEKTHSSPKRKLSSEKTHSIPKRKLSSKKTHSSPRREHSSERSPKRRRSSERTTRTRSHNLKAREDEKKSKQSSSSSFHSGHSSRSAAKNKVTKSDTGEKKSVSKNDVKHMDSDSDLEGLEVIADDGEELVHDIDKYNSTTHDQSLPSEPTDKTDFHTKEQEKTGEDLTNVDASDPSNHLKDGQKFEDQKIKEEDHDLPKILKNCVTLDEFTEEMSSDTPESEEANDFIPKTEESSDEVATSTSAVSCNNQCDGSESLKGEDSSKTTAEPMSLENLLDPIDQPEQKQNTERKTNSHKEAFGKILEVRNLPSTEDYTALDLMNIMKRYGDVTHHVLFPSCKKGFVEMMYASDAERVAADSESKNIALHGNILKIKVSEKYCHLPEGGFSVDSDSDNEDVTGEEISKESNNQHRPQTLNGNKIELSETDEPVGIEFVRPVVGYFCSLCDFICASEEEAKGEHCRSLSHHEKVKEHKERNVNVENKK